jgi:hypothetical protein
MATEQPNTQIKRNVFFFLYIVIVSSNNFNSTNFQKNNFNSKLTARQIERQGQNSAQEDLATNTIVDGSPPESTNALLLYFTIY